MSSDEEDVLPSGRKGYVSFRKHFVALEVSELGYHLDNLHHQYFSPKTYERRRAERTVRLIRLIPNLPINAYDSGWRRHARLAERAFINPEVRHHPFIFHTM